MTLKEKRIHVIKSIREQNDGVLNETHKQFGAVGSWDDNTINMVYDYITLEMGKQQTVKAQPPKYQPAPAKPQPVKPPVNIPAAKKVNVNFANFSANFPGAIKVKANFAYGSEYLPAQIKQAENFRNQLKK